MSIAEAPLPLDDAAAAPPPPPAKRGWLAILAGVIAWPRNTFTYLRDQGGRSWLVPLALTLVLTLAARLIAQPIQKAEAERLQAEIQAQIDAQQNGAGANGDGGPVFFAGPVGAGPISIGNGPAASPSAVAINEFGLPLLGVVGDWVLRGGALLALAWILGGRPTASSMFRMGAWTLVPDLVRLIVTIAVMLATSRIPVRGLTSFNPGATNSPIIQTVDGPTGEEDSGGNTTSGGTGDVITFSPGSGGPIASSGLPFMVFLQSAFFSSLDIYLLWALVLLGIGVAVTARLGIIKAAVATLLYFGLSVALAAVPPLFSLFLMQVTGGGPGNFSVGP